MSDPFSSLRDTFADIGLQTKQGIDSISASFEQQNEAIAQMLTSQREAMEKELSSYRQIMEQKLNDIPSQFQSISQMALAVKSLGSIIVSQKSEMEEHGKIMSTLITQLEKSQSLKNQTNPYMKYLTIGVFGSFVLLLIMLITQIFGINLHL
jgi:DNA repair exonuclease SbcCD ATPase subunit